ncbi:hypothetical protein MBLNU459_g1414t1 [Dothideomycetes sp. NU459]
MSKRPEKMPVVSIFDVFIGSGRTIRKSRGPPGLPILALPSKASLPPKSPPPKSSSPMSPEETAVEANGSVKKDTPPKSPSEKDTGVNTKEKLATIDKERPATHEKKGEHARDASAFTPAQDAELSAMKAALKSWKEIAQQLGMPQWQVKKRWHEIKPKGGGGGGSGGRGGSGEEKRAAPSGPEDKDKTKDKDTNNRKKENDLPSQHKNHEGKKDHDEAGQKHHKAASIGSRSNATTWMEIREDELFSFGDIGALAQILERDKHGVWDRAAADFYNMTGRHIMPRDIREKFGTIF